MSRFPVWLQLPESSGSMTKESSKKLLFTNYMKNRWKIDGLKKDGERDPYLHGYIDKDPVASGGWMGEVQKLKVRADKEFDVARIESRWDTFQQARDAILKFLGMRLKDVEFQGIESTPLPVSRQLAPRKKAAKHQKMKRRPKRWEQKRKRSLI